MIVSVYPDQFCDGSSFKQETLGAWQDNLKGRAPIHCVASVISLRYVDNHVCVDIWPDNNTTKI